MEIDPELEGLEDELDDDGRLWWQGDKPSPKPHRARSGPVERPVPGVLPDLTGPKRKEYLNRYASHMEILRQHPGQWFVVAQFKVRADRRGSIITKKKTGKLAAGEVTYIRRWTERLPEEHWELALRVTPDTWGDRDVWLRYVGIWDPDERAAWLRHKAERRQWLIEARKRNAEEAKKRLDAQLAGMKRPRGRPRKV